jgi:hypothetical protein
MIWGFTEFRTNKKNENMTFLMKILQGLVLIIITLFSKPMLQRLQSGGLNQILRRQTSRSHYGSKVPVVTITVFKYRNKIGKIVVKAVPYSVT